MKKILLLAIIMALITACHEDQTHNHESDTSGHEHEVESVQYTLYSDVFEVFIETEPLVQDQNAHFLAHFTFLADFSPLDSATISINLLVGDSETRQEGVNPVQPGIFSFEVEPVAAGDARIIFDVHSGRGDFSIEVKNLRVFDDLHEAIHELDNLITDESTGIPFTKEQSWKIDFETRYPQFSHFGHVIRTTALIKPSQKDKIGIVARTSGVVDLSGENIYEGTVVKPGAFLFSIAADDFAGENSYVRHVEAKNNYDEARANYNRKKLLAEDNIVTEPELLKARKDYETAKAVYENLSTNFIDGEQLVTSPVGGYIDRIYVNNGSYVRTGDRLLDVAMNKHLVLHADVPSKYATELNRIRTANINVLSTNKTYTLEDLSGRLSSYGKSANTDNYLIPVRFEVENPVGLIPGSFVELYIVTTSEREVLSVPDEAILEEQGKYFVMVQLNPELFEKREVRTGQSDGLNTVIISGLQPDERVVTRGAVLVKLSEDSGSLDPHAGHVH